MACLALAGCTHEENEITEQPQGHCLIPSEGDYVVVDNSFHILICLLNYQFNPSPSRCA